MFETLKRDWKAVLIQSVISALVLLGLLFIIAYGFGGPQREEQVSKDVRSVRVLICRALAEAENPDMVRVVNQECSDV